MSGIDGSGSRVFAGYCPTEAARVWAALTDPAQTAAYLHGLALNSTWTQDAFIDARFDGAPTLTGRVLCARPGERLSYLLRAAPDDPPVYLTWLIRPGPGGCTVRLEIDEVDCADSADDAEDTWLPVLAGLQRLVVSV